MKILFLQSNLKEILDNFPETDVSFTTYYFPTIFNMENTFFCSCGSSAGNDMMQNRSSLKYIHNIPLAVA